jgi:hypothetical protein
MSNKGDTKYERGSTNKKQITFQFETSSDDSIEEIESEQRYALSLEIQEGMNDYVDDDFENRIDKVPTLEVYIKVFLQNALERYLGDGEISPQNWISMGKDRRRQLKDGIDYYIDKKIERLSSAFNEEDYAAYKEIMATGYTLEQYLESAGKYLMINMATAVAIVNSTFLPDDPMYVYAKKIYHRGEGVIPHDFMILYDEAIRECRKNYPEQLWASVLNHDVISMFTTNPFSGPKLLPGITSAPGNLVKFRQDFERKKAINPILGLRDEFEREFKDELPELALQGIANFIEKIDFGKRADQIVNQVKMNVGSLFAEFRKLTEFPSICMGQSVLKKAWVRSYADQCIQSGELNVISVGKVMKGSGIVNLEHSQDVFENLEASERVNIVILQNIKLPTEKGISPFITRLKFIEDVVKFGRTKVIDLSHLSDWTSVAKGIRVEKFEVLSYFSDIVMTQFGSRMKRRGGLRIGTLKWRRRALRSIARNVFFGMSVVDANAKGDVVYFEATNFVDPTIEEGFDIPIFVPWPVISRTGETVYEFEFEEDNSDDSGVDYYGMMGHRETRDPEESGESYTDNSRENDEFEESVHNGSSRSVDSISGSDVDDETGGSVVSKGSDG